jgi:hypothetical protein
MTDRVYAITVYEAAQRAGCGHGTVTKLVLSRIVGSQSIGGKTLLCMNDVRRLARAIALFRRHRKTGEAKPALNQWLQRRWAKNGGDLR